MNPIDMTIIYFACGAPFGVYFFLKNRTEQAFLLPKTFAVTILWVPYAFLLLRRNFSGTFRQDEFPEQSIPYSTQNAKVEEHKKTLENFLSTNETSPSLFVFRELIERYAGLSIATQIDRTDIVENTEDGNELFRISRHKNVVLATTCLNRRNRGRLKTHQKEARGEFLDILSALFQSAVDRRRLGEHSLEFVKLLSDNDAVESIENLIQEASQEKRRLDTATKNGEIWNLERQQQSTNETNSENLPTLTLTATASKRD